MFGIIICPKCRRKRIIDLDDASTVCPHCGSRSDTGTRAVLYRNVDQGTVRAVFASMTGFVPEEKARSEDADPMSTLAYKAGRISDIGLKLEAICDGLTEIKGTFTLGDVEEVAPGKGERFVKMMLDGCMIYEVSSGRYRKRS